MSLLLTALLLGFPADEPVRLTVHPAAAPVPALKYQLLPEVRELNAGNPVQWYARCFADFDPATIAAFDDADVARCLADPGIVRNRAKVAAAVGNARAWLELDDPAAFLWSFVDGAPLQNHWTGMGEVPATTAASDAMSKALKKAGFRFVGPTICYAFMQSCGFVNDHVTTCFRHSECAALA